MLACVAKPRPLPPFSWFSLPRNEELLSGGRCAAPRGPGRRWLSYLLYAGLAAVLGFVLWQQWQA